MLCEETQSSHYHSLDAASPATQRHLDVLVRRDCSVTWCGILALQNFPLQTFQGGAFVKPGLGKMKCIEMSICCHRFHAERTCWSNNAPVAHVLICSTINGSEFIYQVQVRFLFWVRAINMCIYIYPNHFKYLRMGVS